MSFIVEGFDFDEIELVELPGEDNSNKCAQCAFNFTPLSCLLSNGVNDIKARKYFKDVCTKSAQSVFQFKTNPNRKKKISDII